MKLSDRLKASAQFVRKGSYPADIGTDHAYIPIYLIKESICQSAVATDVKEGPLNRARRNVLMYDLQDKIRLKLGYGLEPVFDEDVNCAVLAGMGGYLISNILESGKQKALKIDYFILQPMQFADALRKYLYENDYYIYDERLIKENGKIFQVIAAEHGKQQIDDEIYFEIGKKLIENKDPLLEEFILLKITEIKKVLKKIASDDSSNALKRVDECSIKLKEYEEVLRCL